VPRSGHTPNLILFKIFLCDIVAAGGHVLNLCPTTARPSAASPFVTVRYVLLVSVWNSVACMSWFWYSSVRMSVFAVLWLPAIHPREV
jgi:hypothetical protein